MNIDIHPTFISNINPPKGWKFDGRLWIEDVYKKHADRMDDYIFITPGEEYPFTLEITFIPGHKNKSLFDAEVNTLPDVADLTFSPNFRLPTINNDDEFYKFHVFFALKDALHGKIGSITLE